MADPNQTQPSVLPPATMPLVALILSVLGLCLFPLAFIGVVLAIISLVRSADPAYAQRKTLAIIALVLPVLWVPVAGILAAIAIPNFIHYQTRSKQAECRVQLKAALTAEESHRAETERYTTHPAQLDFALDAAHRYAYWFADKGTLASAGAAAGANDVGFAPAPAFASPRLEEALGTLRGELGVRGKCPACSVTIACAGNVDADEAIDVWSISSAARTSPAGEDIPAWTPFHHVDDLTLSAFEAAEGTRSASPVGDDAPADGDDVAEGGWVTYSSDGRSVLRQASHGPSCALDCTLPDGRRAWEAVRPCVSATTGRRFVSPDCERWLVLIPAPVRGKPWCYTRVMEVYERDQLAYAVMGATVLPEQRMATSPSWLKGCFGVPGPEPRYAKDGWSVDYVMVDGTPGSVPLVAPAEGDAPPPPVEKKRRTRRR